MTDLYIDGQGFKDAMVLLKSMIRKDKRVSEKLNRVQLSLEDGILWGYASNGYAVMRVKVGVIPDTDDFKTYIEIPRFMPNPSKMVKIQLNNEQTKIGYDNTIFICKQLPEDGSGSVDIVALYNQLRAPYDNTVKNEENMVKSDSKSINKVCLNPAYLNDVISVIRKVKARRVVLEVEDSSTRAVRITANGDDIEAFILPIRPSLTD